MDTNQDTALYQNWCPVMVEMTCGREKLRSDLPLYNVVCLTRVLLPISLYYACIELSGVFHILQYSPERRKSATCIVLIPS